MRVKNVGPRRYVYMVEGIRKGSSVKQRTLCYLGPLIRLANGVPQDAKRKVDQRFQVDWNKVNDRISRVPLTLEELAQTRRTQYSILKRTRREGFRTQGTQPRIEGELSALSKLAATRFREMFEEIGEREYRMR